MKFVDPNGKWANDANAQWFIEFARQDIGKPYSEVDCSQLVDNALSEMANDGTRTAANDNLEGQISAGGLLQASEKGNDNGLVQLEYSSDNVQVGDLLVTGSHVEIVSGVNKDGTVQTVGASDKQQKVVERKPFNVNDPKRSPFGNKIPVIVRINEKKQEPEDEKIDQK
ncbi:MAG: hypothetical protein HRF51_03060 [bacterium]